MASGWAVARARAQPQWHSRAPPASRRTGRVRKQRRSPVSGWFTPCPAAHELGRDPHPHDGSHPLGDAGFSSPFPTVPTVNKHLTLLHPPLRHVGGWGEAGPVGLQHATPNYDKIQIFYPNVP